MSRNMLSALYMGQENVEVRQVPVPKVGAHDVLIQNIYSSICGTDVAVYTKVTLPQLILFFRRGYYNKRPCSINRMGVWVI